MTRLIAIGLSVVGLLGTAGIASADPPDWAHNHANHHANNQSDSDNQAPCDALKDADGLDNRDKDEMPAAWYVHNCRHND